MIGEEVPFIHLKNDSVLACRIANGTKFQHDKTEWLDFVFIEKSVCLPLNLGMFDVKTRMLKIDQDK